MREIIIIDDDIALCNLIKKCLSTDGYSVDIANNGLDGYKKIRNANNLCLILLDIMLPDFDGFQVLEMIRENRIVKISDNNIELTNKEFDLLYFLASNKGRIFTKKQIYTNVWEEDYLFDDSNIMSFISKLRKKIEPNPEEPTYILTVRGVGYRFSKGV